MPSHDLLLELLCEEIPARLQSKAIKQLTEAITAGLEAERLSYGEVRSFVTPRRLAVLVQDVPDAQPDQQVERKGPKADAPDKAIEGFCKSAGVTRDALERRTTPKGDVLFAVLHEQGKPSADAIKPLIEQVLAQFHWPKSMRWGAHEHSWIRPLRNIACLFGTSVVPVQWGHLEANNITYGHRFMSSGELTISQPSAYESLLESHYVIACQTRRMQAVQEAVANVTDAIDRRVKEDHGLLEEVTGLVEYPVALCGNFDTAYLTLPPEVLVLEMRHHQKYFAVHNPDGTLSNHFVAVANIAASDGGARILAGNQRVLRARLDDGVFFWNQDRKRSLDEWARNLPDMVFHQKLGSMADKAERVSALATFLGVFVPRANLEHVSRAASLCKADLTTGMVGEFPELQGIMGRYYALEQGEPPEVADAIRDHYRPVGLSDDIPHDAAGIALALADKLDTLCGLFSVGDVPTGSKDPFALRRAAIGILRIIREHEIRVPLRKIIKKACSYHETSTHDDVREQILSFILDRLKVILKEESVRYDVIDSALRYHNDDDIIRIIERIKALDAFLQTDDGEHAVTARSRASNIVAKEEKTQEREYSIKYETSHLQEPEEEALASALASTRPQVEKSLKAEAYTEAMQHLAGLRTPMDAFFENVQVNAQDDELKENRLRLCANVRQLFAQVANFDALEG